MCDRDRFPLNKSRIHSPREVWSLWRLLLMMNYLAGKTLRIAALGFALAHLMLGTAPIAAETAWVKDELRINLRTGPGTEFRILGVMKSGDRVTIVERQEGWTQVQPVAGDPGWIPVGYLLPTAPASVRLESAETRASTLQGQLDEITTEAGTLRSSNETLSTRDVDLSAAMEELKRENQAYQAAAEWGAYIAGAGILATGMIVGWLLKSSSSRSRSSRIRL
jgi:uncharacterized protein YraI